jgi:site-specific recombinase XerD
LRFVLDFAYATGLRASELVQAKLGMIKDDAKGNRWLHLVGKGSKTGTVVLPPIARVALDRSVDLTTVRDNVGHASVSTTSVYLHTDKENRAVGGCICKWPLICTQFV